MRAAPLGQATQRSVLEACGLTVLEQTAQILDRPHRRSHTIWHIPKRLHRDKTAETVGGQGFQDVAEFHFALSRLARAGLDTNEQALQRHARPRALGDVRLVRNVEADIIQIDEANLLGSPGEWEWASSSLSLLLDVVKTVRAVHLSDV